MLHPWRQYKTSEAYIDYYIIEEGIQCQNWVGGNDDTFAGICGAYWDKDSSIA